MEYGLSWQRIRRITAFLLLADLVIVAVAVKWSWSFGRDFNVILSLLLLCMVVVQVTLVLTLFAGLAVLKIRLEGRQVQQLMGRRVIREQSVDHLVSATAGSGLMALALHFDGSGKIILLAAEPKERRRLIHDLQRLSGRQFPVQEGWLQRWLAPISEPQTNAGE
jgi:hypothetical protein